MKRLLNLSITVYILGFSSIIISAPIDIGLSRSVVKIMALSANGKQNMGSGVVIGSNKIATNCHVTRTSSRAYLLKEGQRYSVLAQAALPEFDVCILKTEPLPLPVANLASLETIQTGDDIAIFGYPYALGMRMLTGQINGLHTFQQDQIIEINTGFTHGASGGGVFNSRGNLIGLITFIGKQDKRMHFYAVLTPA